MPQNPGNQPTAQEILTGAPSGPTPPVPTPPAIPTQVPPSQESQQPEEKKLLLFDPNRPPKSSVTVMVHLPEMLEGHAPFVFVFRIKLSADMQRKRDAFLNLAPKKQNEQEEDEILAEVCDLLAQDPTGFAGWPQTNQPPSEKLQDYLKGITNPVGLQIAKSVLRSANIYYWNKVTPREFFPTTENIGA